MYYIYYRIDVDKEGYSMGKNPIVPFLLIMGLGIGLIFFMSLYGLDQKDEIANADTENAEVAADFDAESFSNAKCVSCHGGNLEGGGAPGLVGTALSKEELKDIMKNGTDGGMPGGLVPDADLDAMADYILSLE